MLWVPFFSDLQKCSSPLLEIWTLVLQTGWVHQSMLRIFSICTRDICNLGLAKVWLHNFKLSKDMKETFISRLRDICTRAMLLQLFIASAEMQLAENPAEFLLAQWFEEAFSLNSNARHHYFSGFGSEDSLWTIKLAFWKHFCLTKLEHNLRVSSKWFSLTIVDQSVLHSNNLCYGSCLWQDPGLLNAQVAARAAVWASHKSSTLILIVVSHPLSSEEESP